MTVKFSVSQIESLLAQENYKPMEKVDLSQLTPQQGKELANVVTFGQDILTLFDKLVLQLQTLPTQTQYVEAGLPIAIAYIKENKPKIVLSYLAKQSLSQRLARTYLSKVIELHLNCIIAEQMPHMTIRTSPLLDSVMGIDLILEDDTKRYYVHVTSNSPFAQKMLIDKENRGGYKVGNAFVPYSRDFSGDLVLRYNNRTSHTTKMVNGMPLFDSGYIKNRFLLAEIQKSTGEPLSVPYSKLQHFKDWVQTNLKMDVSSI